MVVIDGLHRVEAFRRLGRTEVQVVFFAGHDFEAVVRAIEANVKHGKPLSRGERQTAARHILSQFLAWSDRRVGEVCGLSHATIATIRSMVVGASQKVRVGRYGRSRHVDRSHRHTATERLIDDNSDPGVRRLARVTGASHSAYEAGCRHYASAPSRLGEGWLRLGVVPELKEEMKDPKVDQLPRLADVTSWLAGTAISVDDLSLHLRHVPLSSVRGCR